MIFDVEKINISHPIVLITTQIMSTIIPRFCAPAKYFEEDLKKWISTWGGIFHGIENNSVIYITHDDYQNGRYEIIQENDTWFVRVTFDKYEDDAEHKYIEKTKVCEFILSSDNSERDLYFSSRSERTAKKLLLKTPTDDESYLSYIYILLSFHLRDYKEEIFDVTSELFDILRATKHISNKDIGMETYIRQFLDIIDDMDDNVYWN